MTRGLQWLNSQLTGAKLLWNILFYLGHVALFAYGWWKQATDARLAGLNTLKYSVWTSRGAGLCLGVDGLLLVLPVLRNVICLLRPLLATAKIPLDEHVWFHRQIAHSTLFWTIVHVTAHYVNMFNVERTQVRKETAWAIMYTQPGGFTGHVMLLIMFLMYTSAHLKMRRQCYEAFWLTHHLSFFFLLGLYTHATGCFVRGALPDQPVQCLGYNSWQWTIWAGIAYAAERLVREVRARRSTRITGILIHPSGVIELRFVKPSLRYKSGQWLFLNVPTLSSSQWHPFTISSAPDDPYISCHIRQVGDWTSALGQLVGCTPLRMREVDRLSCLTDATDTKSLAPLALSDTLSINNQFPPIRIDGPFGAPTEDVFLKEAVVLIGTGIGVTPFASVLKNIWYKQQQGKLGSLRRVVFIWCCRDTGNFEWFQALLKELEEVQEDPDFLRIHIYLTQNVDENMLANISINDSPTNAHDSLDPLTQLRSRTHFGRPNFARIFTSLRQEIEQPGGDYFPGRESVLRTEVGVFCCGPNPLAKHIKAVASKASDESTIKFSFKKEHF